jgi:hypothetical protein
MAREESRREDLLREATAFVERIELVPSSSTSKAAETPIVVGFRADGALSVFFAEDPVYQFNAAGELRRAYCDGLLLKAVRGRLISLQRVRCANEVQLVHHELTDAEQNDFLAAMKNRLHRLAEMLAEGDCEARCQAPPDADVLGRVQTWLAMHDSCTIAVRPNV